MSNSFQILNRTVSNSEKWEIRSVHDLHYFILCYGHIKMQSVFCKKQCAKEASKKSCAFFAKMGRYVNLHFTMFTIRSSFLQKMSGHINLRFCSSLSAKAENQNRSFLRTRLAFFPKTFKNDRIYRWGCFSMGFRLCGIEWCKNYEI